MLVCARWQEAKLAEHFRGRQSNDTWCCECDNVVRNNEGFFDVKLDILEGSNLLSAMRATLKPAELTSDNRTSAEYANAR